MFSVLDLREVGGSCRPKDTRCAGTYFISINELINTCYVLAAGKLYFISESLCVAQGSR